MNTDKPTNAFKILLTLAGICLVAGLTLGAAYIITREQIAYQEEQQKQQALTELFEDREISEEMRVETPNKDMVYWKAYKNGQLDGYAIKGKEYGYGGEISFVVALDSSMKVLGVVILSQNETPGLGTRIAEKPVSRYIFGKKIEVETTRPWFLEQFAGLNPLENITVKKMPEWHNLDEEERETLRKENNVTTITGATISSEAVANGINAYVQEFKSHYPGNGE